MSVDLYQNRVRYADNVLPVDFLRHVVELASGMPGYDTNFNRWDTFLWKGSGEIRLRNMFDQLRLHVLAHLQTAFCEDTFDFKEANVIYTEFYDGALIPWHDDDQAGVDGQYAFTIYLNDDWVAEDGGAFVYEAKDGERYVYPAFNTAVMLRPPVRHRVTPCTAPGKVRRTLQIFGGPSRG